MRKAFVKGHREAIQVADRFPKLQNLSQTLEQVFGTHAEALKQVEKQVFSTDAKVLKQVETTHNISVNAEANACPVVPRFPQNTSLNRIVQSASSQDKRRTIHEQGKEPTVSRLVRTSNRSVPLSFQNECI